MASKAQGNEVPAGSAVDCEQEGDARAVMDAMIEKGDNPGAVRGANGQANNNNHTKEKKEKEEEEEEEEELRRQDAMLEEEHRELEELGHHEARYTSARLVLLGTGASSSVPNLTCLLNRRDPECTVCHEADRNPLSRNRRGNPSMLIQLRDDEGVQRNILIDAGKTFAASVARFFPKFGVKGVDALVLSHDHADAVLGIDDLRSVHYVESQRDEDTGRITFDVTRPIEAFCSDETYERMQAAFPYLIPKNQVKLMNAGEPKRFVSRIKWNVVAQLKDRSIDIDPPFSIFGFELQPVRMMHGGSYICLGFVFGPERARVAYLSDVKTFPKPTMDLLKETNIEMMIIDCLYITEEHNTHMCLTEVLQVVRFLKPKRTILVGMTHEFDYHTFDELLCKHMDEGEDLNIAMGYDGMPLEVDLS